MAGLTEPDRRQRFPRTRRLTEPSDFKRVFENSLVSSDHCFRIIARPNGGLSSRLGMAVSRKVDRRAVGRNRIKRITRESFRQHQDQAGQIPLDFVVLPRLTCSSHSNAQLFDSLQTHWRRLQEKAAMKAKDTRKKANG